MSQCESGDWRQPAEYPDYAVNKRGDVLSAKTGRLLMGSADKNGYSKLNLRNADGVPKTVSRHGLVARAFHGAPAPGEVVNHKNCVKDDCRAENLEWATRAENSAHAARMGRYKSKLTPEKVREMRRLARDGVTYEALAKQYGVAIATAHRAVNRVTWKHVADETFPAQSAARR